MRERARLAGAALALLLALAPAAPATAQGQPSVARELDENRRRLSELRAERERLEAQQRRLRDQVHTAEDELQVVERQRESTARLLNEIDRQIGGLGSQLERLSAQLILAQDNLAERRAVLERRLVDIYKRGGLYTFQALFAAESFGDLLSRYKYLALTSRQDRALLAEVQLLRDRVSAQRDDLLAVRGELDRRREEREAELARYGSLAEERARRLRALQRTQRATADRLAALARDEARLGDLLASLERRRRTEATRRERRGEAPAAGSITTADLGRLDWPVDGRIVYRFGRDTLPSGGVIRWNGIGIAAAAGTPVRAVESGTVRLVGQFGTYGLTVVLEHGNGYYSVYSHLREAAVKLGDAVQKLQPIGAVGGENTEQGAHLHFEIRGENQVALDPANWLRRR